jgi:hypothetical protein
MFAVFRHLANTSFCVYHQHINIYPKENPMKSSKKILTAAFMMVVAVATHAEDKALENAKSTLSKVLACEAIAESISPAEVEKLIQSVGAQTDERAGNLAWYTLPNPVKVLGHDASGIVASYGDKPWFIAIIKNASFRPFVNALKLQNEKGGEEWARVIGKRKIIVKGNDDELGMGCYLQK